MKQIFTLLGIALLVSCAEPTEASNEQTAAVPQEEVQKKEQRIVSLNAATTEVLIGLGLKDQLVGVDVTSSNMLETENLGHSSRIASEAVLALRPSLVVYKANELSAQLLKQLKDAGIEMLEINPTYTVNGVNELIAALASETGTVDASTPLLISENLKEKYALENEPKVIFIYARGPGAMQMAGSNTPESKVIELAGGINPFTTFEDYKPVTAEALVEANPDFVLMYESGFKSLEKANGLAAIPGIMETTAGKNNALITMDANALHNFSLSLPNSVEELNKSIQ